MDLVLVGLPGSGKSAVGRRVAARHGATFVDLDDQIEQADGRAIPDPRNRWALSRGRVPVWLDVRSEVLAQRLRRSPNVRPLVHGGDPLGRVRALAAARERFYGAAHRVNGVVEVGGVVDAVERLGASGLPAGTTLLRATTKLGEVVLG